MKRKMFFLALSLMLWIWQCVPASAYEMSVPGQVPTVSAGFSGQVGLVDKNGTLWMCGQNTCGQLGNGTTEDSKAFIKIMGEVNSVSCGDGVTAAIKKDGSLWMWGNNYNGALTGDKQEYVTVPKRVMDDVVSVSCGGHSIAAIKKDGTLWTWGENIYSQCGNGTTESSTTPVQVMEDVAAVSIGGLQAAVIKTDGSLWVWGIDCDGNFPWSKQPTPKKIMDDVIAVSCGYSNTAVIKQDHSLWIWGANDCGQLANRELHTFRGEGAPRKVLDDVVSATCGGSHITAVTEDGLLWTWGKNASGQLGNGLGGTHTLEDGEQVQLSPAGIMKDAALTSCSILNTIVVKTDGSVLYCGRSSFIGGNGSGTDVYGYEMHAAPVPLTSMTVNLSSPAAIAAKVGGFNDVREADYYAAPVSWAVESGITAGTSKTTFSPSTACSTAQIITFLWRAQGQPEPNIENPFSDVSAQDYSYKAVLWAHEKGLIEGTAFHGSAPCTRGSTVTYLWKLAGSPVVPPSQFTDVLDTADYAQAVAWAVEKGITGGTSATTFNPNQICTRGQIVTFLYRAYH